MEGLQGSEAAVEAQDSAQYVIWRAYYMEFRKPDKKKKRHIATLPYLTMILLTPNLRSVLEGMYWKRRMEAVCAQYKRWRTYNRHAKESPGDVAEKGRTAVDVIELSKSTCHPRAKTPQNLSTIEDFSTLTMILTMNSQIQSVQCGNADIMQPGLLSLQPSIEEIMSVDGCFTDDPGHMVDSLDSYIERMPSTIQEFAHPHPMRRGPPQVSSNQQSSQQSNNLQANRVSSQSNSGGYSAKEYEAANGLNMLVTIEISSSTF
uniref:Uncharacterized protein n=1 Tax=Ditylenchus dipsaci TaxID=166011 RepID=A0A915DG51_9BILA